MAEVWKRGDNGMKVTEIAARHVVTQWSLGQHRDVIAARARAVLAASRYEGDARITTEDGDIDKYVTLDDTAGLGAAMSIEFGRGPDTTSPWGPMEPVAPLRIAASIPVNSRSIGPRMRNGKFSTKGNRRRR